MRLALILLFTCSSQAETLKLTLEQARELAISNHPSLAALAKIELLPFGAIFTIVFAPKLAA